MNYSLLRWSPLYFHIHFPQDLLETRELLEEVVEGKQRIEEQLRLRERELTALKGALKEEVASRDQEVEQVRQQYQRDAEQLRRSMQDATQACDKSRAGRRGYPREGGCLEVLVFFDFSWSSRELPLKDTCGMYCKPWWGNVQGQREDVQSRSPMGR